MKNKEMKKIVSVVLTASLATGIWGGEVTFDKALLEEGVVVSAENLQKPDGNVKKEGEAETIAIEIGSLISGLDYDSDSKTCDVPIYPLNLDYSSTKVQLEVADNEEMAGAKVYDTGENEKLWVKKAVATIRIGMKPGKYYLRARQYSEENGSKNFGPYGAVREFTAAKVGAVKNITIKKTKKGVTATWKKVALPNGYEKMKYIIVFGKGKKGIEKKWWMKDTSKTSYTWSNKELKSKVKNDLAFYVWASAETEVSLKEDQTDSSDGKCSKTYTMKVK